MVAKKATDKDQKFLTGIQFLWVLAIVLALALLRLIDSPLFVCHPHWELFLRELAFALLIASLFALTIEHTQRKQFVDLVNEERKALQKDVFLYAYGSNLHEDIRQEMRSSLLEQAFYRHGVSIDWEFSPASNNAELMEVKKRYSFVVVNTSKDPREWMFNFFQIGADDLKAVTDAKFVRLRVTRRIGGSNPETTEYQIGDMKVEVDQAQPHTKKFYKPFTMEPEEEMGIYYEVGNMRRLYGDDTYRSKEPVVGTSRVRLRFPPNFEVQVACKGMKPLNAAADNDPPTRYSLEWTGGLLPHTGFSICWSRKGDVVKAEDDPQPPLKADAD